MSTTYVPASELIGDSWPHWLGTAPDMAFLDSIGVSHVGVARTAGGGFPRGATFDLAVLDQLKLELPCLPGFELHTGASGTVTSMTLEVDTTDHFVVRIDQVPLTLHLPPSILQRCVFDSTAGTWSPDVDTQTNDPKGFDFVLSSGMEIDFDDETIALETPNLDIPPDPQGRVVGAMIASTGVIVTMTGLHLVLQDTAPPGHPYPASVRPGFRGVAFDSATVTFAKEHSVLPAISSAILTDCAIGSGGFTGTIELDLGGGAPSVAPKALPGGTLFGIDCRLRSFSATFAASVPTASSIQAYLQVPFFSDPADPDKWLEIEASIGGQTGDLLVRLANANQADQLVTLDRPNLGKLDIESLAFLVEKGVPGIELSGKLTPEIPGLTWPALDLNGLRIDAEGHVTVPGGLLTLPKAAHLDLHGFSVELSAIGLGKYDAGGASRQFFSFSGEIRLCDDLAGAAVRNLRVSWPTSMSFASPSLSDFEITCEGISIEVEIPDVLMISGSVDFADKRFSGSAILTLEKPFEATLGVEFVVGHVDATLTARAYKFWFLDALLDLPVGIPIAQTGMAVFGGEALAGKNWAPDKQRNQSWFDDWYLAPPKGLGLSAGGGTQSSTKWTDRDRSWVFGAGLVLATMSDAGYTFATKALVVVSLPGPVIFIEGRAQFLNDMSNIENGDPPYRAVAILDFETEEFLIGFAAHYAKSSVIDITATAETYFSLRDPAAWHMYLGRDVPESKRVQALILSVVHASAYFMLDARRLHTGASVSWSYNANVGPLSAGFFVAFDEYVDIFWHPLQLAGSVRLSGNVHLSAFGVGLGLAVDAGLSAQAPTPLAIAGSVHVALHLPWPVHSVSGDVGFSWTSAATPNYWIDPLESVALVHPLAAITQAWTPTSTELAAPTVPLDAHPVLRFGRPLNPGTSVAGVPPATSVAKPGTLGFEGELLPGVSGRFVSRLTSFTLERFDGTSWETVSQSASPLAPGNGQVNLQSAVWGTWLDLKDRNGDWAPLQFELWNRYAFSRADNAGSVYRGDSIRELGLHLCDAGPGPVDSHCSDFSDQPAGRLLGPVFRHAPGVFAITRTAGIADRSGEPMPRVLFLQPGTIVDLALDVPAAQLEIRLSANPDPVAVTPSEGSIVGPTQKVSGDALVTLKAASEAGITSVRIAVSGPAWSGYINDAVVTQQSGIGRPWVPASDCIRLVEDLLISLAQGAHPEPINSLLRRLEACVSGKRQCARFVEQLDAAVHSERARRSVSQDESVAAVARRLMECLLNDAVRGDEEACATQLQEARRLIRREVAAFGRVVEHEGATPNGIALFVDVVSKSRTARVALSACASQGEDGAELSPTVVGVGDHDDHSRWLAQIPGLSANGSDVGCSIRQICWRTRDDADVGPVLLEMSHRADDIMNQFNADLPLLRPNSTYRLSVTTSQENSAVAASPTTWSHVSYFKTAGPPGAFVAGDPLDRLEPYLASSIPPDGASNVFTTYDLGVIFNEPYVDGMYANQGFTLELHLSGPDGTPAKDANGKAIVLTNSWSPSETTTLQSYQQIIGAALASSDCHVKGVTYQHDSMASSPLASGVALEPDTHYAVDVRAGAVGAPRQTLHYGFQTGRHADFAALVAAARTSGPMVTVPALGSTPPGALMAAAFAALGPIDQYDADADDLKFRAVIASLSLAPVVPVATSRPTLLSDGSNAPLILFEFDQAIDLRRLTAIVYLDPPSTATPASPGSVLAQSLAARTDGVVPLILRSGDGRAVLFATPSNTDLSAYRVSIRFMHHAAVIDSVRFPNEPHLLRGGIDADESAAIETAFYLPTGGGVG